jgi:hypothetical protein
MKKKRFPQNCSCLKLVSISGKKLVDTTAKPCLTTVDGRRSKSAADVLARLFAESGK